MSGDLDEAEPQNHATLNFDFGGVSGTWVLAHLLLPHEDRELGRRATALNLITTAEGLPPNWQELFPRVLDALSGAGQAQGQSPPPRGFKPYLAVDNDKPAA